MAVVNGGPQIIEPLGRVGGGEIRSAHLVSQVQQHLGDPAHADAADPDKMDASDLSVHAAAVQDLFHKSPTRGRV